MLKSLWLSGAAWAVLSVASAAQAESSTQLGEVIVTAQKVKTNVQITPIAIQTIAGSAITTQGINDAKDLGRLVASLTVQPAGGSGSSFFIRGVGNSNGNANTDNGIAVSLDQFYFSREYGPDLILYDIDHIEVLKGPQGTLYGRNSTGGVINVVSTKPTFDELKGYARLELGNYGEIRSNAAINIPLSNTLAARFALQTNQHNAFLNDGYDDTDNKTFRGHLLWKPTPNFSLLVSAEYGHAGGRGEEPVFYNNNSYLNPSNPYQGEGSPQTMAFVSNLAASSPFPTNQGTPAHPLTAPGSCFPGCLPAGFAQTNVGPGPHPYQVTNNGYVDTTIQSFRADMEWNLGFGTLSVIPAVLNTYYDTIFHLGPPPFYNKGSARQHSLEVRLASPQDQRFTWLAGLFGQEERQSFEFIGALGAPLAYQGVFEPNVNDRAGGIFAQTTFKIVPTLTLTTGIRYSVEEKTNRNSIADNSGLFPGIAFYSVSPLNTENSSAPTYRVGLDWRVTPHNLLYASYATGFHSGGVELGQPPVRPICMPNITGTTPQFIASVTGCDAPGTYLPEHLTAYTVGSKNRFFDDRFQLNLEAYDWEYTNLQVGTLGLSNPRQSNQVVVNAGSARIRGVDVEALAKISANDEIGVSANYNSSRYGTLVFYNYIVGLPFPPTITNLTGKPFTNAPKFTLTADYHHVFDLPGGATLIPMAAVQYSSTVLYSAAPLQSQPAYYKLDLNLSYHAPKDRFEVQLFARNLNNAATIVGSGGNDSTTNLASVFLAPPRTYGASVQVNF